MGGFLKGQGKYTRFGMVFLLVSMAAALLMILVFLAFRTDPPFGALAFVIPLAAAMIVGQWQFEEEKADPAGSGLWQDSFIFAAIGVAVLLLMGIPAAMSPTNLALIQEFGIFPTLGVLIGLYLVFVLAIRLGLGLGITAGKNKK